MPIPACKHQARKLIPLLARRMRGPMGMREFIEYCRLYIEVTALTNPLESLHRDYVRDDILEKLQTELEQGT